ncbi:MAG: glycosyltransferase family 87 protein [Xanthobacteraceae bacterium]
MATVEMSREQAAAVPLAQPVVLVCFALVVAHVVYLGTSYVDGLWPDGAGVPSDFVGLWSAGKLALAGHPAAVYDWPTHKLMEESAIGHPFDGFYGWRYAPTFLLVASVLALLPYTTATMVWTLGTFPAYLATTRAIVGDRIGYLLAAAFPAVLANAVVGQNGFLTAALIGGTLILIERRPILAGVLLGLLTYKPHLGLLFPVALIAGRHWRVFVTAAVAAMLIAVVSWLAFGTECWQAFFASIGHNEQAFLSQGHADWGKLQTAFGLTRTLGGSEALAWTAQAAVALIAAGGMALLWRSDCAHEIKAAALGCGVLLATPYLYAYDLVALAVPLAFLFRLGRTHGFLQHELAGIGLACLLVLIFPFVKFPVGFGAVLMVAALTARRAVTSQDTEATGPDAARLLPS